MTRSQSVGSESRNGLALSQPALLTSTSIRPNWRFTCATITPTDSCEVTSVCMPTASPPIATAVSFAVDSLMSVTTTIAPLLSSFPTSPTFPKIATSTGVARPSRVRAMTSLETCAVPSPISSPMTSRSRWPSRLSVLRNPQIRQPHAGHLLGEGRPQPGVLGLVVWIRHVRGESPQFLAVELVVGVETEVHADPGNLVADGSVPVDVSVEVGLALLSERRGALEAFRRGGEQVQRRHGEVAQTRLVVGVGVEGLLEEPDGGRALVRDLGCPLLGFLHQLVGGHHLVDQTHLLGRSRVVHPT